MVLQVGHEDEVWNEYYQTSVAHGHIGWDHEKYFGTVRGSSWQGVRLREWHSISWAFVFVSGRAFVFVRASVLALCEGAMGNDEHGDDPRDLSLYGPPLHVFVVAAGPSKPPSRPRRPVVVSIFNFISTLHQTLL